jgi:hypothetical protein
VKVWSGGNSIVSLQATYRALHAIERGLPPGLRREENEADLRAVYCYSFSFMDRPGFLSAEAAYRVRAGLFDEWRADLTIGYRVMPRFLLMLQNFNTVAKAGGPLPAMRSHKLQFSAVFAVTENWSVQGGVYGTLLGVSTQREQGFAGGLWRKF